MGRGWEGVRLRGETASGLEGKIQRAGEAREGPAESGPVTGASGTCQCRPAPWAGGEGRGEERRGPWLGPGVRPSGPSVW